jgi:hypothetical protein
MLNKVVSVVLEVEKDEPEYFRSYRIGDQGHFCSEIEGVLFVGTLIPSNKYPGHYEQLNDLFALKACKETREIIKNPKLHLGDLLSLMGRYWWVD